MLYLTQYDVDDLLDTDIKVIHEEEHSAQHVVNATAEAFPGLGIVAAVQGVILTMGKLTEGTEVIGASVAAALVGTFLGVLAAYGFASPLATKISNDIAAEGRYLVVIKYARRSVFPNDRPSFDEMDAASKTQKAA
jgi:chemotaxis protein MotA